MTGVAILFLILAIVIVWGGLVASTLYLRRRPSRDEYPPGGTDDERVGYPIIEHDT